MFAIAPIDVCFGPVDDVTTASWRKFAVVIRFDRQRVNAWLDQYAAHLKISPYLHVTESYLADDELVVLDDLRDTPLGRRLRASIGNPLPYVLPTWNFYDAAITFGDTTYRTVEYVTALMRMGKDGWSIGISFGESGTFCSRVFAWYTMEYAAGITEVNYR